MEHPTAACLAEVVVIDAVGTESRGSGYLVASGWVLTAAHVVAGSAGIAVWLGAPAELRADEGAGVNPARVRALPEADLALLPVPRSVMPPGFVPPLLGMLDRESPIDVAAVATGFPWFKLREAPGRPGVLLREVREAHGIVAAGSNLKTGTAEFRVADPPAPRPESAESPWAGMSGAAVFVSGHVVGVVGQHHPSEGLGTLTVRPLHLPGPDLSDTRTDAAAVWADALQQLQDPLPVVAPPGRELVTRAAAEAASRLLPAQGLVGRRSELADLSGFATDPERRWRWIQAAAFAGKSALLAWFALHAPDGVDLVACFLVGRFHGCNSADYALTILSAQLAVVARRDDYQPAAPAWQQVTAFHDLLSAAAAASRQRGRRLLLVVDGLDEYDTHGDPLDTWLPNSALLPAGVALLASSRVGSPVRLAQGHPLYKHIHELSVSPAATALRDLAEDELARALAVRDVRYSVVGYLAAAGGGLTSSDLVELLQRHGQQVWATEVDDVIAAELARTIRVVPDPTGQDEQVLVFAHDILQEQARTRFTRDLSSLLGDLHAWAGEYRDQTWPANTPSYLITAYPHLLYQLHDTDRAAALSLDTHRHERLFILSGADFTALNQIHDAQLLLCDDHDPDLTLMGMLALQRTDLSDRCSDIPSRLPGVFATLGLPTRALNLARSITDPDFKARALSAVASALCAAGQLEQGTKIAAEAAGIADRFYLDGSVLADVIQALVAAGLPDRASDVTNQRVRIFALSSGADHQLRALTLMLASVGLPARAAEVAAGITDPCQRVWALTAVAEAFAADGQFDQAAKIAQQASEIAAGMSLPDSFSLARVTGGFRAAGLPCQAAQTAAQVTDPLWTVRALADLAVAVARSGDHERAAETFDRAVEAANTISRPGDRALAEISIAKGMLAVGSVQPATAIATSITDPHFQVKVVNAFADAGQPERAAEIASGISDSEHRAEVQAHLAEAFATAGQSERATAIATGIARPGSRAGALAQVARALAANGQTEDALKIAESSAKVATGTVHPKRRATALIQLAKALAPAGESCKVAGIANQIADLSVHLADDEQVGVLSGAVEALSAVGRRDLAAEFAARAIEIAARVLGSSTMGAAALKELAEAVVGAGDPDRATQIVARITDNSTSQGYAAARLAAALISAGELDRANDVATRIADPDWQVWALARVSVALAGAGRPDQATTTAARAHDGAAGIADPVSQTVALAQAAMAVAACGQHDRATAIAKRAHQIALGVADSYSRDFALFKLAVALATAGEADLSVEVAPHRHPSELIELALALLAGGHPERAIEYANEAAKFAHLLPDDDHAQVLAGAAEVLFTACAPGNRRMLARAWLVGQWTIPLEALAKIDPNVLTRLADAAITGEGSPAPPSR